MLVNTEYEFLSGFPALVDWVAHASDSQQNLYVGGNKVNDNDGVDLQIMKYNRLGDLLWEATWSDSLISGDAYATAVAIGANFEVYVSGAAYNGSTEVHDMVFLKYSSTSHDFVRTYGYSGEGYLRWSRDLHYDEGHVEVHSLHGDPQGHYYLNGIAYMATGQPKYIAQKLATLSLPQHPVTDSLGQPLYMDHQAIVAFQPSLVSSAFVHDRDKHYTSLEDFVPDSTVAQISAAYGEDVKRLITVEKIFKRLTPHDTISLSRNGYEVRVPAFYSRVLLHLPVEFEVDSFLMACNTVQPHVIYSQFNDVAIQQSATSDEFIGEQHSLIPSQIEEYQNASINVGNVWESGVYGHEDTRVGVYDDIIYWQHPDFGDGTLEGSKIAGGYDYAAGVPLESVNANVGFHGTAVAGIIGALRDNDIGIAGIAGGDGQDNTGASLYSLGIFSTPGGNMATLATVSEAMVEGAMDSFFGLHIVNHSWVFTAAVADAVNLPLLREGTLFTFNNECTIVTIRGNGGNVQLNLSGPLVFPSGFPDSWTMTVGGSGHDGAYKKSDNGDPGWEPSYENIDFIAPGASCLIKTTSTEDLILDNGHDCIFNDGSYAHFAGTSAAAPHVAGVAALMHAHHHTENGYSNNLAPEDYEQLLKKSAVDIGISSGYEDYDDNPDPFNGHGRIDATAAFYMIDAPNHKVVHRDFVAGPGASIVNLGGGSSYLGITLGSEMNGLGPGNYESEEYGVSFSFSETLGNTDLIESVWKRESSSISFSENSISSDSPHLIEPWSQFDVSYQLDGNSISGTFTTICLKVFPDWPDSTNFIWLPTEPEHVRTNLSLHVRYDETVETKELKKSNFGVFPNPGNSQVTIRSHLPVMAEIRVYSATGHFVFQKSNVDLSSEYSLDISAFTSGLYILEITDLSGYRENLKLIKL